MHTLFSMRKSLLAYGLAGIFFLVVFSSCGNTRHLVYMQGGFDTAALSKVTVKEPIIQKGDLISIVVYSDNPDATKIYNQSLITTANSGGGGAAAAGGGGGNASAGGFSGLSPTAGGYLVDEKGNIEFYGLGVLHVDSLTRAQLRDTLDMRLKDYLINPYYSIRFLNSHVTLLGEVQRPGIFPISGDRLSILEALGDAGDMTFYGRRDNILVIRTVLGKREFARLDITKPDILVSPYFYLQADDVVIIEPTKKKVAANDQTSIRDITIASSIISTLALLYSIFKK
jgi:polysaccharide export outer membrane protein